MQANFYHAITQLKINIIYCRYAFRTPPRNIQAIKNLFDFYFVSCHSLINHFIKTIIHSIVFLKFLLF